jgi:peptidoglycan/LPS O-acetylase OafA/YrhL
MLYHSFFLAHLFVPEHAFDEFVKTTPIYLSWIWGLDKSVDVFFVISGFLIGKILFKEHQRSGTLNLRSFYWRRYLRLTPAYAFAMIVFYIAAGAEYSQTLWANILYVNNFLPLTQMSMPWTWTLAVEEQFYLLFPLLLLTIVLPSRYPLRILIALFVLSFLVIAAVIYQDELFWTQNFSAIFSGQANIIYYFDTLYVNLHTRFGTLLCGVILAYLTVHHFPTLQRLLAHKTLAALLTVIAIIIMVAGVLINGNKELLGDSLPLARALLILDRNLFGIAVCWIILMCSSQSTLGIVLCKLLSARIWYPFAQLSYSLYLFHYMLAIPIVGTLVSTLKANFGEQAPLDHHWFLIAFVLLLIVTTPISFLTYIAIERPFINLRKPNAAIQPALTTKAH